MERRLILSLGCLALVCGVVGCRTADGGAVAGPRLPLDVLIEEGKPAEMGAKQYQFRVEIRDYMKRELPRRLARYGMDVRMVGDRIFIAGRDDATEKSECLFKVKMPFPRKAGRYEMTRELGAAQWDFERGTLYGVYRFLEELDCRWFFPGPKGWVVPSKKDLVIRAFELDEEPAYILRKVGADTWQGYMLDVSQNERMTEREEFEELGWVL